MIGVILMATLCGGCGSTDSQRVAVAPAETLTVTISGEGPRVVLLPGLFGGAFGFRHLTTLLVNQGFQTIVIEPLGIGESARPPGADYSLTAQADRVAAVLDRLRERSVLMVAHSLGASIAFRVAYRRPDLVAGILSLDGGPTEEIGTPGFRRAMHWAPLIRLLHGVGIVRGEVRRELRAASGNPQWVTDSVVRGYTAAAARDLGGTLRAYRAMANARELEALAPHLSAVRCPVRLLVGSARHDGDVDSAEVQLLRRQLPVFAVDSVVGAGHYLQEEQPGAVAIAVRSLQDQLARDPSVQRGSASCASP